MIEKIKELVVAHAGLAGDGSDLTDDTERRIRPCGIKGRRRGIDVPRSEQMIATRAGVGHRQRRTLPQLMINTHTVLPGIRNLDIRRQLDRARRL